jgi:hypothetical protein
VRWRERIGAGTLAAAGTQLFVLHEMTGDLRIIDASPAGYRETTRVRVFTPNVRSVTGPSIANGRLYIRNPKEMAAFELSPDSLARLDVAAQPKSPSPSVVVPYGDVRFTPLNPSVPNGAEIGVLRGDPAKGPSTMLMRMRKAAGRLHVHTADYELIVVEGMMKHWSAGENKASAKPLGPGSYWFQPGGAAHADSCLTDTCVMYITWAGPRDGRLAEPRP